MSTAIDNNPLHLYPPFREKLQELFREMFESTREKWEIVEGYRSHERQAWLYAQGRSRPGPIVTWMRVPSWHGTGLAADVKPSVSGYNAPDTFWRKLLITGNKLGLSDPAFRKGDLGHQQLSLRGADYRRALDWVAAGFPDTTPAAPPAPNPKITLNGEPLAAPSVTQKGKVYVELRPLALELHYQVVLVADGKCVLDPFTDDVKGARLPPEVSIPVIQKGDHSYAWVRDLGPLGLSVQWDPATPDRVTLTAATVSQK